MKSLTFNFYSSSQGTSGRLRQYMGNSEIDRIEQTGYKHTRVFAFDDYIKLFR